MSNLISRQAAIDLLKKAYWNNDIQSAKDDPCIIDTMIDWAIRQIKSVPAIEAESLKYGKWINDEFGSRCSSCGLYAYRDKFGKPWESPYCPNCGAKMECRR